MFPRVSLHSKEWIVRYLQWRFFAYDRNLFSMHKWLSHALKGGAGPAHRWCAKDDALPDLPLVISDSQGVFTADPQCVAELYAQEWEREWGCDDACSFEQELRSNRALREASQWDVNFAGKWDSALEGNFALRAPAACAAGIELAHREGRYVIHFLWDMLKFCYSIKAHLLIPQLVARGNPIEILALGNLTHKSPRCLQVGYGFSDVITGCASSISAGCLQSCSWAGACCSN